MWSCRLELIWEVRGKYILAELLERMETEMRHNTSEIEDIIFIIFGFIDVEEYFGHFCGFSVKSIDFYECIIRIF